MSVYPVVFGKPCWYKFFQTYNVKPDIRKQLFQSIANLRCWVYLWFCKKRYCFLAALQSLHTRTMPYVFETRKLFLTAYLRFHLGDIHREDIWQYHSTGNIDGHSAIISKIPSYTRIFRNPKLYNNLRKHYWRTELWWSLSSFFIGGILLKQIFICFNENFYIDSLSEKKQCICIKGADKHADWWSTADMDFSWYSAQVFCLKTWIRCVWSGSLELCTEVWQHSLFYFWKDVYIYSRTCSTESNLPSWSISFLYLCVIPSAGWNRGRVIITYCLIYTFLAPVW